LSEAIKLLARTHQTLIWDHQRQVARLRAHLRDFYPAALAAFGEDLAASDVLELLNTDQLRVPAALQRAYAVTVKSSVAVIAVLVAEITTVGNEMVKLLRKHADAEIYLSQPGMGETLSARA
jgi:hypothetical protein